MSEVETYIYGICAERRKPGGCQLHNLQCGYPDCDRVRPTLGGSTTPAPDALATAREEGRRAGRLEGLKEAAQYLDKLAMLSSAYTTQTHYRAASAATRELKEKQP